MKIESRGKYPGVKVHLEPAECETFLSLYKDSKTASLISSGQTKTYFGLSVTLGKEINSLLKEHPGVLKPRTNEEIEEALKKEAEAAALKLRRLETNQLMEDIINTLTGIRSRLVLLSLPNFKEGQLRDAMVTDIDTLITTAQGKIKSWNKEAQEKGTAK